MLQLGEVLHKSLAEIGAMSQDEFEIWKAYFRIKNKVKSRPPGRSR